jgi:hypothetical protein
MYLLCPCRQWHGEHGTYRNKTDCCN